jgi:predicted O-methyltransferase YrrM
MLHRDALVALYYAAYNCEGAILEIGSFVGGATIVMASATQRSNGRHPIFAVEVGGTKEHGTMPSADIIGDLRSNLAAHGVLDRVTIIHGWSNLVSSEIAERLSGQRIGLLLIDADGNIGRDFDIYRPMLVKDAVIVIDDYIAPGNTKAASVYPWVASMIANGVLKQEAILPYGTWFGRYTGG